MADLITAPYGTWPSPLSGADLASAATTFTDLVVDGQATLWLQGDPSKAGRYAVMRHTPSDGVQQLSPDDFNARTRVHEYGGGALAAGHGVVLACSWDDQRVYRITDDGPVAVTPEPQDEVGIRWQAMRILPGGGAFVAVRETHGEDRPRTNVNVHGHEEAINEIVHVDLSTGVQTVLVSGPDFVGGPWPSPDGTRLAWIQWDHPDMPWDSASLWLGTPDEAGLSDVKHIAGGDGTAVHEATWSDDGQVFFTDDRSGWTNLYVWDDGAVRQVQQEPLDVSVVRWVPSTERLSAMDGAVFTGAIEGGLFHLRRLPGRNDQSGDTQDNTGQQGIRIDVEGVTEIQAMRPTSDGLVAIAGGPSLPTAVWRIDPATGHRTALSAVQNDPAAQVGAVPTSISFPTPDGAVAHGLFYAPTSATHVGPATARPPLIVLTHGGPTGTARSGLNATAQYWSSRGFAVVDVNYRGSAGFGRAFRDALKGNWGIHDVTDCVAATTYLADQDQVDPHRLIIEGGSAGGYTTLLALCTTDAWAAGGSLFGVADLGALARDTHKFESRYLDSLVGAWPVEEQVYIDRSPITHVDRLATPMIVLQGDEDKIVPPEQAELIVSALRRRGVPHAYLLFEGEQHGFRKAANITRSLEARLAFYGRVLGFAPADDIDLPEYVDA